MYQLKNKEISHWILASESVKSVNRDRYLIRKFMKDSYFSSREAIRKSKSLANN